MEPIEQYTKEIIQKEYQDGIRYWDGYLSTYDEEAAKWIECKDLSGHYKYSSSWLSCIIDLNQIPQLGYSAYSFKMVFYESLSSLSGEIHSGVAPKPSDYTIENNTVIEYPIFDDLYNPIFKYHQISSDETEYYRTIIGKDPEEKTLWSDWYVKEHIITKKQLFIEKKRDIDLLVDNEKFSAALDPDAYDETSCECSSVMSVYVNNQFVKWNEITPSIVNSRLENAYEPVTIKIRDDIKHHSVKYLAFDNGGRFKSLSPNGLYDSSPIYREELERDDDWNLYVNLSIEEPTSLTLGWKTDPHIWVDLECYDS